MIVVASALRKEQMKSEEIISLENELGRDWKRRKEFYKIRNNMERGGVLFCLVIIMIGYEIFITTF